MGRPVTTAGVAAAVVAALLLGVYLYVYKRRFSPHPPFAYVVAAEGAAAAWYLPVALAAYASGTSVVPPGFDVGAGAVLAGVFLLSAAAATATVYAVQVGEVSYVAPLAKLVPVFVLPIEVVALGVTPSTVQVAGVLLATAAVYVANSEADGWLAPFRRAATYPPAQLALVSALLFGVVDVGKRLLLSDLALPVETLVLGTLAGIAAGALPVAVWRGEGLPRAAWPGVAAVGVLLAVGQHLVALAFQGAPASVASPVVNTQAVVAVVLGGVVLEERAVGRRFVAAGLAVAGVAAVAIG